MAYQTGTFTTASGLLSSLESFASANGWTIDDSVGSNKFALSKNDVYVSARFDSPTHDVISLHQALGHTPAATPGDHPDDSGSGYNSSSSVTESNLDRERHVDLSASPANSTGTYYFFENDASPAYIHVVAQKADLSFRHFGFGELNKFGAWTGGEYCYGHSVDGFVTPYSSGSATILLDGRFSPVDSDDARKAATIHLESFPDQVASGKWGEVKAGLDPTTAQDSAAVDRYAIQGGYRGGLLPRFFGNFPINRSSGYINLIPIQVYAVHQGSSPKRMRRLGELADVRGAILNGIAPGEEIAIGSETWVFFPSVQKGETTSQGASLYQGIAYRKEVA